MFTPKGEWEKRKEKGKEKGHSRHLTICGRSRCKVKHSNNKWMWKLHRYSEDTVLTLAWPFSAFIELYNDFNEKFIRAISGLKVNTDYHWYFFLFLCCPPPYLPSEAAKCRLESPPILTMLWRPDWRTDLTHNHLGGHFVGSWLKQTRIFLIISTVYNYQLKFLFDHYEVCNPHLLSPVVLIMLLHSHCPFCNQLAT